MDKFLEQLAAVTNAPIPFGLALIAAVAVIWGAFEWRYGGVISNKDSEITLLKSQRDDYREKLGGASPDQAKAKLDALEQTVRKTIGGRWEPLTSAQIAALTLRLKSIPSGQAQVMYENALGRELAETILAAFRDAGWSQAKLYMGSGFGDGVITGWGDRGVAVKDALIATGLQRVTTRDPDSNNPQLLIVGIGINSY